MLFILPSLENLFLADPPCKALLVSNHFYIKKPQVDNVGSNDPIQAFPY
jgi:hypothetical protein